MGEQIQFTAGIIPLISPGGVLEGTADSSLGYKAIFNQSPSLIQRARGEGNAPPFPDRNILGLVLTVPTAFGRVFNEDPFPKY